MIKSQHLLLLSLFAIIITIASSCSSKFSVCKRRYMKGFHVNLTKNTKANKANAENIKNESLALKKINISSQSAPLAFANQKETIINAKNSFNSAKEYTKKANAFVFNDRYRLIATNVTSTKNILNSLIGKHKAVIYRSTLSNKSKLTHKQKVKVPFDVMGWGGISSVFVYIFASMIASVILYGLFFLMLAALSGAIIPVWLIGFLITIGILIILGIIVVVVINGD